MMELLRDELSTVSYDDQTSRKRKRVVLSLQQKKEVFQFSRENPGISQAFIADVFSSKWSKNISRRTVGDILNNKDFEGPLEMLPPKDKYFSKAKHANMEHFLHRWFLSARSQNIPITDNNLISTAKAFGDQLMISDFSYSAGWLAKFKRRFSIDSNVLLPSEQCCDVKNRFEVKSDEDVSSAFDHSYSKRDNTVPTEDFQSTVMLVSTGTSVNIDDGEDVSAPSQDDVILETVIDDIKELHEIIEAAVNESDEEKKEMAASQVQHVSSEEALHSIKTLMNYMETSQDFSPEEVCTLFRIENKIRLKSQSCL